MDDDKDDYDINDDKNEPESDKNNNMMTIIVDCSDGAATVVDSDGTDDDRGYTDHDGTSW